jgi:hypothetical protein
MLFEKVVTTTPLISYSDVTQIGAIGGVLIFFGIIAMIVDEFNPLYLLSLMFGIFIVFCGVCGYTSTKEHVEYKQTSLSIVSDKIKVDGDKVIIDVLDPNKDNSKYYFVKSSTGKDQNFMKKNIFKFETDDYYEVSYLVAEDGGKIKLSEEDTKFLKERGVK